MKLRKEMVKVNDKVCKGRKCFIVSMLFYADILFFSIGFMEQSSKKQTQLITQKVIFPIN